MLRRGAVWLQAKKVTAAQFASAGAKTGSEEKFGQAALEYVYERNQLNDGRKRQRDVDQERAIAAAHERYAAVSERNFAVRMERLIFRMNEALEAMPEELRDEACLLNSEQPPLNLRRPTLTPPVPTYEPGFGLDVAQLRSQMPEYPPLKRATDGLQAADEGRTFPFVDPSAVAELTRKCAEDLERRHGELREAVPLTGAEGEAWEAYVALNKKALARQQLILDLSQDPDLAERYDTDEVFRAAELQRRGVVPLEIEGEEEGAAEEQSADAPRRVPEEPVPVHFAAAPKYEPFRKV